MRAAAFMLFHYLHLLFLGQLVLDFPGPPQRSLQAQYFAVSLSLAAAQLCLALKDFLAAAE